MDKLTHRTHRNSGAACNPTSTAATPWGPLGQEARFRNPRDNCRSLKSECRNLHQLSPGICGYAGRSVELSISDRAPGRVGKCKSHAEPRGVVRDPPAERSGMLDESFHVPDDAYVCLLPLWQMMDLITRAAEVVCYKCTTQNCCATYYIPMRCKEVQVGQKEMVKAVKQLSASRHAAHK